MAAFFSFIILVNTVHLAAVDTCSMKFVFVDSVGYTEIAFLQLIGHLLFVFVHKLFTPASTPKGVDFLIMTVFYAPASRAAVLHLQREMGH